MDKKSLDESAPLDIDGIINLLTSIKKDHGNIKAVLKDADTGDNFELHNNNFLVRDNDSVKYLSIEIDYIFDRVLDNELSN